MSGSDQPGLGDVKVDVDNLYREESFTDLRVASIRQLIPVKRDGSRDTSREIVFIGNTNVMSSVGPLPIESPIDAGTLEDAIEKFPEAVEEAFARLVERAKEQQREQASRIVVPGAAPTSNIQLP